MLINHYLPISFTEGNYSGYDAMQDDSLKR